MERDVLHLAIPAFPIALARVGDAALRGRPVAVAPGHSERALIQSVSAEAEAEGVHAGMAVRHARRFCPSLILLPPDPRLVGRGVNALAELSGAYTPILEPAAPGRLFLDLTGCRRLLGPGRDVAARLEREVADRLRLAGAVGVAGNKLVSRIAAGYLARPGVCDVLRGSEAGFIGPLPVSVLPGVGRQREQVLLSDLNLRRIEQLARLTVAQLRLAFGPFAPLLHQRSRGIDPSPVQLPRRSPQVAEESFLEREENDDDLLLAELCRLVEGCGVRLRRMGKGAGRLTLTVTYADGVSERRSHLLPASRDQDRALLEAADALFKKAGHRRVRVRGLRLHCDRLGRVQGRQLEMFAAAEEPPARRYALQQAIDMVREKHGMDAARWGRGLYPS